MKIISFFSVNKVVRCLPWIVLVVLQNALYDRTNPAHSGRTVSVQALAFVP